MDKPLNVAAGPFTTNEQSHNLTTAPPTAESNQPTSPTQSEKSSDSEGRPVREKLKETRIDAQGTSEQPPSSDLPMNDATVNGNPTDASASGSDNERGRLRRKRSREDFEDEHEDVKPQGKKHERHVRKKSRDVTSPIGSDAEVSTKKANGSVPPIAEHDGDTNLPSANSATDRQATPDAVLSDKEGGTVASPKNKRKLEQAAAGNDIVAEPFKDTETATKVEERDTKRVRDGAEPESISHVTEKKTTIPPGSGFSNTSSISPFASVPPKSPVKSVAAPGKDLPQTSDQAFKSSGFGSFASSSVSPFAASNGGTSSPFGATNNNKLSSFASKPATSTSTPSGFASLGSGTSSFGGGTSSTKSIFAGSTSSTKSAFGGSLGGSAFANVIGGKPALSTFGGGGIITGLNDSAAPEFGAAETKVASVDEDDDGDDDQDGEEGDDESERRSSQQLLQSSGPPETGEENEDAVWAGRAKLYTLVGQAGSKSWQERGVGPLKLNVTREEPLKARFVLRADGTHRLLLNVAITSNMSIGDASGNEPKDGKLLFTAPTTTGEVESHILKLKVERAAELWKEVDTLKKAELFA
ncbi:hypothetical protein N0V90_009727 [Kalmusia sp. IMI 367209]|nr:hypothetical protein N0V90_009727 [Kalmusia sp. IMI 367209]